LSKLLHIAIFYFLGLASSPALKAVRKTSTKSFLAIFLMASNAPDA